MAYKAPNVARAGYRWTRLRRAVLDAYGWQCAIRRPGCTGQATTVDHILPMSRGGAPLDPANLQAACRHCNTSKGAEITQGGRLQRRW